MLDSDEVEDVSEQEELVVREEEYCVLTIRLTA